VRSLRFPVPWDGAALLRVRSPVAQTFRTGAPPPFTCSPRLRSGAPCPCTCSRRLRSSAPGPFPCSLTRSSTAPWSFTCCTDPPQRCSGSVKQFPEAPHCCSGPIELLILAPLHRFEPSHPSHEQRVASLRCRGGLRPPCSAAALMLVDSNHQPLTSSLLNCSSIGYQSAQRTLRHACSSHDILS
jgi:hypothetical protein